VGFWGGFVEQGWGFGALGGAVISTVATKVTE